MSACYSTSWIQRSKDVQSPTRHVKEPGPKWGSWRRRMCKLDRLARSKSSVLLHLGRLHADLPWHIALVFCMLHPSNESMSLQRMCPGACILVKMKQLANDQTSQGGPMGTVKGLHRKSLQVSLQHSWLRRWLCFITAWCQWKIIFWHSSLQHRSLGWANQSSLHRCPSLSFRETSWDLLAPPSK